jgi:hypothetical protein
VTRRRNRFTEALVNQRARTALTHDLIRRHHSANFALRQDDEVWVRDSSSSKGWVEAVVAYHVRPGAHEVLVYIGGNRRRGRLVARDDIARQVPVS